MAAMNGQNCLLMEFRYMVKSYSFFRKCKIILLSTMDEKIWAKHVYSVERHFVQIAITKQPNFSLLTSIFSNCI